MLRRLSTRVGLTKHKKDEEANGTPNGHANGRLSKDGKPGLEKRGSSFIPIKSSSKKPEAHDNSTGRVNVEQSFEQFAQLIHAARSPLPTQSGDGSYLDHAESSGFMQDVKALGFEDARTLMDVMKTKTTGQLQDDKTYIMERVIQVSSNFPFQDCRADQILSSWRHCPPCHKRGRT